MIDQLTHIADVKVGKGKGGRSRVYLQFRLPSRYADLAGKKASVYEMRGSEEGIAFFIRIRKRVKDYREAVKGTCRGF
jgi:hypothetical protein